MSGDIDIVEREWNAPAPIMSVVKQCMNTSEAKQWRILGANNVIFEDKNV